MRSWRVLLDAWYNGDLSDTGFYFLAEDDMKVEAVAICAATIPATSPYYAELNRAMDYRINALIEESAWKEWTA